MTEPFRTSLTVRMFEIDAQGHLTGSAYLDYANQALWECLRAAGIDIDAMIRPGVGPGIGPVNLETNIRFLAELRAGDEVSISCTLHFSAGKTFTASYEFRTRAGVLAAEVKTVMALLDLSARQLVAEPAAHWRAIAPRPEMLGLRAAESAALG
ncbi:acyl-CoA thioesterase [Sphingomonas sp.]|uniref:acyl-CoA thioesterase n=1 Tax=Sphingomonas sp. TaxID=28214 RepID=UPI003D6D6DC4